MPDIFHAIGSDAAGIAVGFDSADLLKPPGPPAGDYLVMKTVDAGAELIADYRPLDPNAPNLFYPIQLFFHVGDGAVVSATIRLALTETPEWGRISADALAYVKRYDAAGVFKERYDLRDPATAGIAWSVDAGSGRLATVEVVVKDPCRAADLDASGAVGPEDFVRLGAAWRGSGPAGDVDGDETVDFGDLVIMARYWLCDCDEQ